MKFGKNIKREMLNYSNLPYLNYKNLKQLIKNINKKTKESKLNEAEELNNNFEIFLYNDLNVIEETFSELFNEISNMKNDIEKKFLIEIDEDIKKIEKNVSFDDLLFILKEKNVSKEFFDFCIQLIVLSNKCKILRTYVIYNYVGLIKILKKKKKNCLSKFETISVSDVIKKYSWCLSNELPKLISSVNIICDEFMQNFIKTSINKDKYTCPICLCLINDPVILNSCFHSFCWKCLATAIHKYSIDVCPICRTKIIYDKNSIQIDGILSQFLKKYFYEEKKEIKENNSNLNEYNYENFFNFNYSKDESDDDCLSEFNIDFCKDEENINKETQKEKCDNIEENILNTLNKYNKNNFNLKELLKYEKNNENEMNYIINKKNKIEVNENKYLDKQLDIYNLKKNENSFNNIEKLHQIKQININKGYYNENHINDEDQYIYKEYRNNGLENKKEQNSYVIINKNNIFNDNSFDKSLIEEYENINKYLSVLNKNDINENEDKEKESDYSSDEFHTDYIIYNNKEKDNEKTKNDIYNYNVINNVISYTLN